MNPGTQLPAMPWLWAVTLAETFSAGLDPAGAGKRQRAARLARLLAAAAAGSPFYRARLPADGPPPLERANPARSSSSSPAKAVPPAHPPIGWSANSPTIRQSSR